MVSTRRPTVSRGALGTLGSLRAVAPMTIVTLAASLLMLCGQLVTGRPGELYLHAKSMEERELIYHPQKLTLDFGVPDGGSWHKNSLIARRHEA
jgi:hypothetical protein